MKRRQSIHGCAAVAMIVLAGGCSNDSAEVEVSPADATRTATDSPNSDPSTSAAVATTTAPAPGDPVVAFTQLDGFNQPVGMASRSTDDTLYIVEQAGRVVIMTNGQPGAVALDMTDLTSARGERGLLGLAIKPDGALAYVNYTDNANDTQIDEYTIAADGTFEPATRRTVLSIAQPYRNHNGGDLAFGPDNMLYIGTGDGGSRGDPDRRSLNLAQALGKMLRIDPQPSADAAYTVPPDNPFVDVGGALPEIWSIGLRNPWRFSFDRSTGDLWIADVGQNQWEEVDVAWAADGGGRGANFGWSAFEGNHPFNADQLADRAIAPIHEYEHVGADCSVSGGALYRGTEIPALAGWYVFADYCSGQVRALQIADRAVVNQRLLGQVTKVTAVREGPDGELFVLSGDGPIYAVTAG